MTPQFEHLLPHEGAVLLLRTTPNYIVASSQKGGTTVIERILDRDEKMERYTHQSTLELGKLWDTACLGDHLVVANDDAVVRLWSLTTKESIRAFHGHESAARAVHLPDERTIVSSDKTGVIRIWDLPSGECRHVLNDHEGDVLPGALASHGELLISGGYDNRVRIWNMISGKCLHVLEHDGVVGIFGWIKDHTHIAAGAIGGPIKIWRISDGKHVATCIGHTKIATRIIDLGGQMMTASADGTMREWDWESGHPIKSITVHEGENQAVRAMEFFGDGSHMVTAGMDGKVKLWDYQSETCTEELIGDGKAVWVGSKLGEDQLLVTLEAEDDAQYVRILRVSL